MADTYTQDDKTLCVTFSIGLPKDALLLLAVIAQEAISKPYSYRVEMLCPDIHMQIDLGKMIGANAAIGVRLNRSQEFTVRDGFVRSFQAAGMHGKKFRTYRAEIVPYLSLLEFATDFCIFQDMTVVDILNAVFKARGLNLVDMRVSAADYPKLETCVQCRETDFAFVSRIMEENGIFYWFDHKPTGSVLVIGDKPEHFAKLDPFGLGAGNDQGEGRIYAWEHAWDHRTGTWNLGDFSFVTPADPPFAEVKTRVHVPAANNSFHRYDFPQHIEVTDDLRRFTRLRMEEEESQVHAVTDASQVVGCAPGLRFNLKSHEGFPEEAGQAYLFTSSQFTALEKSYDGGNLADVLAGAITGLWSTDNAKTVGLGALGDAKDNLSNVLSQKIGDVLKTAATSVLSGGLSGLFALLSGPVVAFFKDLFEKKSEFSNRFIAIPGTVMFRSPRLTSRPRIHGPHTAIVMGTTGQEKPGSTDIHTDQFGRVKVQFIWDPDADGKTGTANSAWLRVAEGWAGGKWGMQSARRDCRAASYVGRLAVVPNPA
jgi:uncharacterized protein involved in type VI secretion and phage assembly